MNNLDEISGNQDPMETETAELVIDQDTPDPQLKVGGAHTPVDSTDPQQLLLDSVESLRAHDLISTTPIDNYVAHRRTSTSVLTGWREDDSQISPKTTQHYNVGATP